MIGGAGPQVTMGEELASLDVLFDDVRREQVLLSRVTLAAVVPLIVLALVLLYVLVAAAAEVRRPEVALAKLRGFSEGRVLRFAVAEPVALLLVAIPLGAAAAVVAERRPAGGCWDPRRSWSRPPPSPRASRSRPPASRRRSSRCSGWPRAVRVVARGDATRVGRRAGACSVRAPW